MKIETSRELDKFIKDNEYNIKRYLQYKYRFNYIEDKLIYFELFTPDMFYCRIFENKNGILNLLDGQYMYILEVNNFIEREAIKKIKDELAIELSLKEFNKTTIKKMKI